MDSPALVHWLEVRLLCPVDSEKFLLGSRLCEGTVEILEHLLAEEVVSGRNAARFRCVSKSGDWPPNYGHFHAENDDQFQLFSSSIYWAVYFQTNPNEVVEILIEGRFKHGISVGILTHKNSQQMKSVRGMNWFISNRSYQYLSGMIFTNDIHYTDNDQLVELQLTHQRKSPLVPGLRPLCGVCQVLSLCSGCPCPIMWCCWRLPSSDSWFFEIHNIGQGHLLN